MGKYYFDVSDDGSVAIDQFGADLVDDDQGRDEALALLPALAHDAMPDGDRHEIVVTVRNERKQVVYQASLTLDGRWWPRRM